MTNDPHNICPSFASGSVPTPNDTITDEELDELLASLGQDKTKIDPYSIYISIGTDTKDEDEPIDIDALLAELKAEVEAEDQLTEERKEKYSRIHKQVWDAMVQRFGKEMRLAEEIETEGWKFSEWTQEQKDKKQKEILAAINPHAKKMLIEKLGNNLHEFQLFMSWLDQQKNGEGYEE